MQLEKFCIENCKKMKKNLNICFSYPNFFPFFSLHLFIFLCNFMKNFEKSFFNHYNEFFLHRIKIGLGEKFGSI
ncbi:MAG: hypothetical protein DRO88_01070 [Promethearchaeia archaeon]|nr:MAG: hypothetical protein DRO88_01070 [Candidatus Lokiarchaeia archaeon]